MIHHYVAFLRAINVGGRTVKMDHLKQIFEALPIKNVSTFIASGNVLFETPAAAIHLEASIELQLRKHLGYPVATFIRTIPELQKVAAHEPFAGEEGTVYVAFLKTRPSIEAQRTLSGFNSEVDRFHVHGREAYWLAKAGFSGSSFTGAKLEKTLGPATARNITTVRKLAAR
ncbi:MAG: DUF1697 domain-containing protein [Vicinamibacterales bacterium]